MLRQIVLFAKPLMIVRSKGQLNLCRIIEIEQAQRPDVIDVIFLHRPRTWTDVPEDGVIVDAIVCRGFGFAVARITLERFPQPMAQAHDSTELGIMPISLNLVSTGFGLYPILVFLIMLACLGGNFFFLVFVSLVTICENILFLFRIASLAFGDDFFLVLGIVVFVFHL